MIPGFHLMCVLYALITIAAGVVVAMIAGYVYFATKAIWESRK